MQLFSLNTLNGLIKPENESVDADSIKQAVNIPAQNTREDREASLRKLMKDVIAKQNNVQVITNEKILPQPATETLSVTEPKPPVVLVATPTQSEKYEVKTSEEIAVVNEDNPAEIKKIETTLSQDQTEASYFLKTFLVEVSDAIQAGNALNEFELKRKDAAEKKEERGRAFEAQSKAKDSLRESLVRLLNQESDSPDLLSKTIETYGDYLEAVKASHFASVTKIEKEEEAFLTKIQKKKQEITILIKKMGGIENYNKIKEVISICKKMRGNVDKVEINAKNAGKEVNEYVKSLIRKDVMRFVDEDLHGAVMLAQENDIIGIMMRVFVQKKETPTRNNVGISTPAN